MGGLKSLWVIRLMCCMHCPLWINSWCDILRLYVTNKTQRARERKSLFVFSSPSSNRGELVACLTMWQRCHVFSTFLLCHYRALFQPFHRVLFSESQLVPELMPSLYWIQRWGWIEQWGLFLNWMRLQLSV